MLCRLRRQLRVPTLARRAAARCRRQLVLRHLGPLGVWLHDRVAALVQLAQVRVLDGLPRGDPLVGVIGKQLRDQVDTDGGGVGHERLQRRGVLRGRPRQGVLGGGARRGGGASARFGEWNGRGASERA